MWVSPDGGLQTGTAARRQGNADLRSAQPAVGGRKRVPPICVNRARQRKRRPLVGTAAPLALVALTWAAACTPPPPNPTWTLDGEAFGTRWTVQIRGPETNADAVRDAIEAELDAVDRSMSNWRSDSELSGLNGSESTDPLPISDPLALVLESALRVHDESGGAFDITVGPLLRLFGFGPGGNPDQPAPGAAEFEVARSKVGSALLFVEREPAGRAVLHRQIPDVKMDLSGIAKGYAVDRLSAALIGTRFRRTSR